MASITTKTGTTNTTKAPRDIVTDVFQTTLTLNFSNGNEIAIDATKLTEEIKLQAMLHGLKQKLCDAAAIPRDLVTGRTADIDDKYAAVKAVYDRITSENPSWNAVREGESRSTSGGIFLRAMMELTNKTHPEAKAALDALSKEQITALKANPKVLAKMHELEMAAAKVQAVNSDDLLDQLGASAL